MSISRRWRCAVAERGGAYRAIRRGLLDSQEFRLLSGSARSVFLTAKLSFGPAGIEVWEPEALTHTIAARAGIEPGEVRAALEELERRGWVRVEANVTWIVGQLREDPHLKAADPKHRKGVQSHVAGLPELEIVKEFVSDHPEWFPPEEATAQGVGWAIEGPSMALARPFEGPSKALASRETETETEKGEEHCGAALRVARNRFRSGDPDVPAKRDHLPTYVQRAASLWAEIVGGVISHGKIGKSFALLKSAGHSEELIVGRWEKYLRSHVESGQTQYASPAAFAEKFAIWDRPRPALAVAGRRPPLQQFDYSAAAKTDSEEVKWQTEDR